MNVIKRDGRTVSFQKEKIIDAIKKAFLEVDSTLDEYANSKINEIADSIEGLNKDIDVEEIQNIVENKLMASKRKDVAKAYVIYRENRSRIRENKSSLVRRFADKLFANDVDNQNANVDGRSFGGRIGAATSEVMKQYALNNCMSKMSRDNHLNNEVYIHDLDHFAIGDHNCLSVPFDDLLANGFNTRQTDVRPAQSINTAFQLLAVIFQLQSLQQFGGVSATHLDWTMVPYVRKSFSKHFKDGIKYFQQNEDLSRVPNELSFDDPEASSPQNAKTYQYAMDMTVKEVYQAVEGMYHNLNTLQSRSGNQLPFTSINYGTCTLPEGRLITKSLLDVSIKGVGKLHKTPVFPCGIFQCMKGVNRKQGEPNYDLYKLALKSTALRLYPNYANCNWSGNEGYDPNDPTTYFSTMGLG